MNMALLAAYMLAVLLLLATPGPVVALVMGTAAREGSRRAFMTVLGTNSASLVLIVLATLMLLGVVALSPVMLSLLGITGSLYIGWSAVSSLMHKAQDIEAVPARGGLLKGFLVGISNPKDILFFVAFFPQFIAITDDFTLSMLTLSLVWVVFDITVLSLYILTVQRVLSGRYALRLERLSALFLLAVALFGIVYNVGEMSTHYH
ncbi:LysE family translocator [Kluyvera sp. CHPC 1.2972]|uniref:LysE family translocator n=1 Tax=Kluyvera sp. CHPC 1.2972 TaxID=2995176 RepID=UPI002FD83F25